MSTPIKALKETPTPWEETGGIDSRAVIASNAEIGPDCTIGPFAVIGPSVKLGRGCTIHPHAVIDGPTTLGDENTVHPFARIGGEPQDLRHDGEPTELVVGHGNIFREHVTINRGTSHGGGETVIGNDNLLMAYSHIAHDCQVGNRVVMANHATVAGHVTVEDHVVFGGMVGVATFLRIGESAMLAAGSMVERDVPPFCIISGDRARLRAINRVGLSRRNIDETARKQIKGIFRALKDRNRSLQDIVGEFGRLRYLVPEESRDQICWSEEPLTSEAARMLNFLENVKRGLTR